eukprot:Tbor_TRINITY_DN6006_c0_g2::TRINITY_DN6006_c0_g2_i1::g.11276::m.11276
MTIDSHVTELHKLKEEAVSECLKRIENHVDNFLVEHFGFDTEAVPFNYLDVPPKSMESVRKNHGILQHCLEDLFLPSSATHSLLLAPLTKAIWEETLEPLRRMLCNKVDLYALQMTAVGDDLKHLDLMVEAETVFLTSRPTTFGPADVVPIGGLIASRLHRLENEARTVLAHWKRF